MTKRAKSVGALQLARKAKAKKNKAKRRSVWTVSGGLPTLGKRR